MDTYAHKTHKLIVTNRFVWLVHRRRTLRHCAIAVAGITTPIIVPTLVVLLQRTLGCTARALRRATVRSVM